MIRWHAPRAVPLLTHLGAVLSRRRMSFRSERPHVRLRECCCSSYGRFPSSAGSLWVLVEYALHVLIPVVHHRVNEALWVLVSSQHANCDQSPQLESLNPSEPLAEANQGARDSQARSPRAVMCSGSRSLVPYMKWFCIFSEKRLASVVRPTASAV